MKHWQTDSSNPKLAVPTLNPDDGPRPQDLGFSSADFNMRHVRWHVPGPKLAYKVLQKAGPSFQTNMCEAWRSDMQVRAAKDCRQVRLPRERQARTRTCAYIGFCICFHWRLRGFVANCQAYMRRCFRKGTVPQQRLLKGMVVLRISSPAKTYWFHVSYVNMSTWIAALLPLRPTEDEMRALAARANRRVALDLNCPMEKRLGINHWWYHFRNEDLTIQYRVALFMLRDDSIILRRSEDFVPAFVEVTSMIPSPVDTIWHGDEQKPKRKSGPRMSYERTSRRRSASASGPIQKAPASPDLGEESDKSKSSTDTSGVEERSQATHDSWIDSINDSLDDSQASSPRQGSGISDNSRAQTSESEKVAHTYTCTCLCALCIVLRIMFRFALSSTQEAPHPSVSRSRLCIS